MITKINAPSNPTFASSSTNSVNVGDANTLAEDNVWGYISMQDLSTTGAEDANWTWDFGSSAYGTYYIKWYANVTGTPTAACVGITLTTMASNDASTWTTITTATLSGIYGTGTYYTNVYLDSITGTYRYIRARIYSNTTCQVQYAYLSVDSVKRSVETATNCWCNSSFVTGNPSCSYTLPSCCSGITVGANSYWATSCAWQAIPNISACGGIIGSYSFTCKKNDGCSCSADSECYNYCWSTDNGKCYNSACIKTLEKTGAGNPACVNGVVVNHDTTDSTSRYVAFNGELYYCKQAGGSGSGYDFVQDVNPGSAVGSWKCGQDGIWRGGTVIGIRGGRIRIV
jgi:hypothetical protein